MKLYSIAKWGELFENNRSRSVKFLDWVSIPNKHDGENYTRMVTHPDGAILFAAWNLLVQVASKCDPRGVLVKDNGQPHDSFSLSMKTRAPKEWFDKALEYLEHQTDWLVVEDVSGACQLPDRKLIKHCEEGKGREGKEGKGIKGDLPKEVEFWNSRCGGLPKVAAMSDERWRHLRSRRQDSFWVANFEQAVLRVMKSDFCTGKCEPSPGHRVFRADFDWMLQSNVVAKIMEGKYDNRSQRPAVDPDVFPACFGRYNLEKGPQLEHFQDESSYEAHLQAWQRWREKRLKEKGVQR